MRIDTDITVLTGPQWLFEMFNGLKNPKGTAEIRPVIDADGEPIIGMEVLDDTTWDYLQDVLIFGLRIRDHLTPKKYSYIQNEFI